jgi:hypothetical protein
MTSRTAERDVVIVQQYRRPKTQLRQATEWSLVWMFFFVLWFSVFGVFAYDGFVKFDIPPPWLFLFLGAFLLACDMLAMILTTRFFLKKKRNWVVKSREEIKEKSTSSK